jgi:ElaB/YqjD/DUF883 family membrane-anchored ribosome-binding protein
MAADKDFQKDLDAIRADIAALTETLGRLAKDMTDVRDTVKGSVKGAAKEAAEAGEELLSDAMKLGGDAARAGMSSMEAEIKRNPLSAVLTALGIGFIIGIIGRR